MTLDRLCIDKALSTSNLWVPRAQGFDIQRDTLALHPISTTGALDIAVLSFKIVFRIYQRICPTSHIILIDIL